jgi:hypothetical protein
VKQEIYLLLLTILFTWQELILIFLSSEIQRLYLEVSSSQHAEYQRRSLRPFEVMDLQRYPVISAGAYTSGQNR